MKRPPAWRAAWLVATALLALACSPEPAAPDPPKEPSPAGLAQGSVTIGIHRVTVEIAEDAESQRQGLSDRDGLAPGTGMLFVYAEPSTPQFWMKSMRFDIDIVWIADGRIVGLAPDLPHAVRPPLPLYRPPVAVDHVLEVPAGTAARLGWQVGDPVVIER